MKKFLISLYMTKNENAKTINSTPIYDCIVIGAGISGISFAHQLSKEGKNILTLESNESIGGQISTYISSSSSDFWLERGAHTCYNSYTHLLSIVSDIKAESNILSLNKSKYLVYDKGEVKSPFSKISYIPLLINMPRILKRSKSERTVREYFRPLVGASNYDKLFSKMFRAVICQEADDYPAEIFLKKRQERRKDIVRKFSFSNGISSFLNTIVSFDKLDIKLNTEVTQICFENEIFTVKTKDNQSFMSYNIALATDPKVASSLLNDLEPDITELLTSIELSQSDTLSIIVHKDDLSFPLVAGIIPTSDQFFSIISRDVVDHPSLRAFSFHFKGGKSELDMLNIVCQVLGIDTSCIIEKSHISHALPALRKQQINIKEEIRAKQKNNSIYMLGNYYYGLSLEDCVQRSYDEANRFISDNKNSL